MVVLQEAEWLKNAGGLEEIKIITKKHDPDISMCGTAMEHEDKRSYLLSSMVKEVTRLHMIWYGFEIFVKKRIPWNEKESTVYAACRLLNKNSYVGESICQYTECVEYINRLIDSSRFNIKEKDKIKIGDIEITENSAGINIARNIRNIVAHALHIPEPESWGKVDKITKREKIDIKILEYASRLILLTIQFIVFCSGEDLDLIIRGVNIVNDERDPISLRELAKQVHYRNIDHISSQYF